MKIRKANAADVSAILDLERELAVFEGALESFHMTEAYLEKVLFAKGSVHQCYLIEDDGVPVGMGIVFETITFAGKPGLFLQDVIIKPSCRGKGYGQHFMDFVKNLAKEGDYARIDWMVERGNTPAIALYTKIGGKAMDNIIPFRLTDDQF